MHKLFSLRILQMIALSLSLSIMPAANAMQDTSVQIRGPKGSSGEYPGRTYGPITPTDTLWRIATKVRPDSSVTIYQVMEALYRGNPQAFADNNINHLIDGQILYIPDIELIKQIDAQKAQQRADNDEKDWLNKDDSQTQSAVVKKPDLEEAKGELNQKIESLDKNQEQRLKTIQRDVLDSIDGLQSLLQENEALRERIGGINEQLTVVQSELERSQELKAQMDDMLKIQQELLSKARMREQELLAQKQQEELERQKFTSQPWFMVAMATVPALFIIGLILFLLRRKKPENGESAVDKPQPTQETKVAPENELVMDAAEPQDELSLGLDNDDELSDDDLDDDDLDDDVINLHDDFDDDLDELDDVLDDDIDIKDLDDDDDFDLDSLLEDDFDESDAKADSEDEGDTLDDLLEEGEALDFEDSNNMLDQGDLDALFDNDDELEADKKAESDDVASEDEKVDVDTVIAESQSQVLAEPEAVDDEDFDIDSLIDEAQAESAPAIEPTPEPEVADDEDIDIDSLIDEAQAEAAPAIEPTPEPEAVDDEDFDIDSLIDEAQASPEPAAIPASEPEAVDDEDFDIDSLIDEAQAESISEADDSNVSLDDLDIDNLLDDIDEQAQIEDDLSEVVSDNELDIDSLLDEVQGNEPVNSDFEASSNDASLDILADVLADAERGTENASKPESDSTTPNREQIEALDEEKVASFLSADLSDLAPQLASEEQESNDQSMVPEHDETSEDEFDIDAIIAAEADIESNANANAEAVIDEEQVDDLLADAIGPAENDEIDLESLLSELDEDQVNDDDIEQLLETDSALADTDFDEDALIDELSQGGLSFNEPDAPSPLTDVDDRELELPEQTFDEEELLKELLDSDENGDEPDQVELTPDFTDANVLSKLLDQEPGGQKEEIPEASEIDDIQELNSLEFDELLASIEEETLLDSDVGKQTTEVAEEKDAESVEDQEQDESKLENLLDDILHEDKEADYVSVENLLSDSFDEVNPEEPYKKENINVGLEDFPEFAADANMIDVDDDDFNGAGAQLDLAKVYLEMGDTDNAEPILRKVLENGDERQKAEARKILDDMGSA